MPASCCPTDGVRVEDHAMRHGVRHAFADTRPEPGFGASKMDGADRWRIGNPDGMRRIDRLIRGWVMSAPANAFDTL
jgi:hypothetical protein